MSDAKPLRSKVIPFFSTGNNAMVVYAAPDSAPDEIVKTLGLDLQKVKGMLSINGGAKDWPGNNFELHLLLEEGIARVAAKNAILVVDGGTDIGVMSIIGIGVSGHGRSAPLIGIAPENLIWLPEDSTQLLNSNKVPLEPNHSHFVLTPGEYWGDEIDFRSDLVGYISSKLPSVSIVADGGEGTCKEALKDVRHGREIIVLEGSGRIADDIVHGLRQPDQITDQRIAEIIRGKITILNVHERPNKLAKLLSKKLKL